MKSGLNEQAKTIGHKRNALRVAAIVVVSTVLVAVAITVSAVMIGRAIAEQDIMKQVSQGYMTAESNGKDERAGYLSAVKAAGLTVSERPDVSSKSDVCYIGHHDQGILPASYFQDCYVRYIDGFETTASRDEVMRLVTSSAATNAGVMAQSPDSFIDECPAVVGTVSGAKLSYVDLRREGCVMPDMAFGRDSIRGPSVIDKDKASVRQSGTLKPKNTAYIVIENDVYYGDTIKVPCIGWPVCAPLVDKAVVAK